MIGFEYRSCCWSIQLSAQRQVVLDLNEQDFSNENEIEYDNSIGLKFSINGLGGDRSSSVAGLFSDSIFAYRRPYLITN
jgi:LPS-assembly protein